MKEQMINAFFKNYWRLVKTQYFQLRKASAPWYKPEQIKEFKSLFAKTDQLCFLLC